MLNNGDSVLNSVDKTADQSVQERLRLFITAKLDENVEANASLVAVAQSTDHESSANYNAQLGRFNIKFKNVGPLQDVTIGRFAPAFSGSDYTQLIFSPGTVGGDGIGLGFENGKLKGNANYIDYRDYVGDYRDNKWKFDPNTDVPPDCVNAEIGSAYHLSNLNLRYALDKNTSIDFSGMYSHKDDRPYRVASLGVTTTINDFTFVVEAGKNFKDKDKNDKELVDRTSWIAQLQYGTADTKKKGSWDLIAGYQKVGKNSVDWGLFGPDGSGHGEKYGAKGWHFAYDYVPAVNTLLGLTYDPGFESVGSFSNVEKSKAYWNAALYFFF